MKTVRSLPPELQALIDEYNSLLKDAGYVNPFIPAEFDNAQYDMVDYRKSDLTYQEFEDRNRMLLNKYEKLMDLGKKLIKEGKIEAVQNPRVGKPNTYIYDRVEDPQRGKTYYISTSLPEAPMFRDKKQYRGPVVYRFGPEEVETRETIKPMKPLKAGRQKLPARELQKSVPIDIPQDKKQLIMKANPRMRTGQEPNYYVIKDGNRMRMVPVEEEELQYYRNKNRIAGSR